LDVFTQHHRQELEKAKRREKEEIEKARQIEKELKALAEREDALKAREEIVARELKDLRPIADYLQAVAEASQAFDTVDAVLHRYETLATTRKDYLALYEMLMEDFGTEEAKLSLQLESKHSHLIDSTMKFNEKITRVNQTKKLNEYRNTQLIKDVQRIVDKNTEVTTIKTSIKTIFARAQSQATGPLFEPQKKGVAIEDSMLDFVKNRFLDLRDIIRDSYTAGANATIEPAPASPSRRSQA
jgi:hypothetical protein